jgi:hypothetical protein
VTLLLCLPFSLLYSDVFLLSLVQPIPTVWDDEGGESPRPDGAPPKNEGALNATKTSRPNLPFDSNASAMSLLLSTCRRFSDMPSPADEPEENLSRHHSIPRNLRIMFVGDSITRYIYLSLVYYLTHGCWVADGDPFLEMKANKNFSAAYNNFDHQNDYSSMSWNDYLNFTNMALQERTSNHQKEECDCYRNWEKSKKNWWNKHVENRYYSDPDRGNYIAYITKFGKNNFHGHWNGAHVNDRHVLSFDRAPYVWNFATWDGLVRDHVAKIHPTPEYFVFNSGHWKDHELQSMEVLHNLYQALNDQGIHGIYRTTTFRDDEDNYDQFKNAPTRKHDDKVCEVFGPQRGCHNVSWTAELEGTTVNYLDSVHFRSHVYTRMNLELLDLLAKFPSPHHHDTTIEE